MTNLNRLFKDDYDRETLLMVLLSLTAVPIIVGALLGLNVSVIFGFAVFGIEVVSVLFWLLSNSVRDAGKALEKRTFIDGMPTTVALRLRENDSFTTTTWRSLVQDKSGTTLLTKRQEMNRPVDADERIEYAIGVLREQMRNVAKFKLLRRELKTYGFWRNMVAMRWWGFGISALSALVAGLCTIASETKALPFVALAVALLGCLYWVFIVRPPRMLAAAERYKDQFFRSLSLLP